MRLPTPLLLITLLSACAPRTGTVPAGEPRATAAPEAARPHRIEPDLAAVLADADTLRIAEVVPGVRHAYAWSSAGPWAIHVLEIDGAVCRPRIEARMPGSRLDGRARTSELAADAIAAVNADFFTPTGAPVGAQVRAREVLVGPVARPVFALSGTTARGATRTAASAPAAWIGRAALRGDVARGADTLRIAQVNRPPASAASDPGAGGGGQDVVRLFTHRFGAESPGDADATVVVLSRIRGDGAGGTAVVQRVDTRGGAAPLDSGVVVVLGRGAAARILGTMAPGDTVEWRVALVPEVGDGAPALEAVGGQPVLLRGGAVADDIREGIAPSFGEQRHPRTAVGITADGRLLWVAVDGRQAPYSDGMSLAELADLMERLGARDAINLDGGGSTTMVVRGAVVNRPSDAAGERPVGNALVLVGCDRPDGEG